jgi:DNA (cytosine-5)-methyltransferase 1
MADVFQVVDLFAGPGGLAEGFSSYTDRNGHNPFNIAFSVEREASAHRTLRLRALLRQFDGDFPPEYYEWLNSGGDQPDWPNRYPEEWANACAETLLLELGDAQANKIVHQRSLDLRSSKSRSVVIGGPPCQAYSLAGRVRNLGVTGYEAAKDKRHFLYQEYIDILALLRPDAFVMENVKGMLSSSVGNGRIFDQVLTDLRNVADSPDAYRLFAIGRSPSGSMTLQRADNPADYVVRAERYGVPQARHRVIIVGIRADLAAGAVEHQASSQAAPLDATVRHVLDGFPPVRSGLSRDDSPAAWLRIAGEQIDRVCNALELESDRSVMRDVLAAARLIQGSFATKAKALRRDSRDSAPISDACPDDLAEFLADPLLSKTLNHSARGHMDDDLGRYFFVSLFGQVTGETPKSHDFPTALAPAHANWTTGKFADRFRVQRWDRHATTVTSHISKDGHYFIHPDPAQCRALTVREAARLQTFPDNYLFLGNRTEQYVQVGNAVPPFLARQIAAALWAALD